MKNAILILIILLILGSALFYIRMRKKKGVKCIGCPSGGVCGQACPGCSGQVAE